ncbi:MAG: DNA-3-methyladenine glycosylase I [OCS116 cluster bacterium]|nr:DNA-3-methyladenine glycosylase I [OCS116 cluster bacterium]
MIPDADRRCAWANSSPEFIEYHDHEWGFPTDDDTQIFEKIILESFQSGLSWRTILAKRDNFRAAFCGFNFDEIAKFNQVDVDRLLNDAGIVRHKGKIAATINNAARAQDIVESHGSLAAYLWQYEAKTSEQSAEISRDLAKDLKKHGWKFVGPTTVYAFMQALGLVNDHAEHCITGDKVDKALGQFKRPQPL